MLFPNDSLFIKLQEDAKADEKAEKKADRRMTFFAVSFFVGMFAFIILLKLLEKWLGIDFAGI